MEEAGTGSAAHPTATDAGSKAVDKKNKMMAHQLLPVSMATATTKKKPAYRLLHPASPVVQLVSEYALVMAVLYLISLAVSYAVDYALSHYHVICSQSALFLRCPNLTDAQAAQLSDLWNAMLWSSAVQAAAAALALWLPCRRRWIRRALAYVALAATVLGHGMHASACLILLAADPGALIIRFSKAAVFLFGVSDLLCFLALVFLGGEEED